MQTEFTEERALWLYEHYRWLERSLPQKQNPGRTPVVFATKEFFPDKYTHDHRSAVQVFDRIRELMGILDWSCRLEREDDIERHAQADLRRSGILGESSSSGPAGTFSVPSENEVVITYSSSQLKNPIGLVATLAHELCHYLLATVSEEPPAGWESLEPLTDLAAVVEGFGVFLCDSAFQFNQWTSSDQQGWSFQKTGYLSEVELGFALAVFCVRNESDVAGIARSLKPNARAIFCDAIDFVAGLEEERQVANKPVQPTPDRKSTRLNSSH